MHVTISYNYMEYGNVVFEDDVEPGEAVKWSKDMILEIGKTLKPIRDKAYGKHPATTAAAATPKESSKSKPKQTDDGNVTFSGRVLYDPKVEFKDGEKGTYAKCSLVVKCLDGVTYYPSFIGEVAEKVGGEISQGDTVKITGELKVNSKGGKTYHNIWNAKMIEPNPNAMGGPPEDNDAPPPDDEDIPF